MGSLIGLLVMAILLVPVLLIALWVRCSALQRRVAELEEQLRYRIPAGQDVVTEALLTRVSSLERTVHELQSGARVESPLKPAPVVEPVKQEWRPPVWEPPVIPKFPPTPAVPPPPPPPPPAQVFEPPPIAASPEALRPETLRPEALPPEPPPPLPIAPEPQAAPAFSLADTLREKFPAEEWEALVGGSLLNKLGALVLVIGLALLLSYSATRVGPAGRVAMALGLSACMLGGGVMLERWRKYLIFARGLLGGGWAALYLTVYAMHALDAARVIENPVTGAILLVAVAAGMILHSLVYRSQTVTGLAYFAAFAALAITPVAAFSVIALVPLGASLLYIAYRFEWFNMALFGLAATYGTCASKATGTATIAQTQSILAAYWLMFEIFDLLRATRRQPARGANAWIAPLNAAAALGLSYLKWSSTPNARLWMFFAGAAAVYFASALLRARLRPPATMAENELAERALSGYEGAITLAAALGIASIFLGLSGFRVNVALLAEAELLFLAAFFLRQNYLRHLAAGVFVVSLGKLLLADIPAGGPGTFFAGLHLSLWTPIALLTSALFYANRGLKRPGLEYSYAAAVLLTITLGYEVPGFWIGSAWLGLALLLFQFGFWARLPEFRYQGYGLAVLGAILRAVALSESPGSHPWLSLGTAAVGAFGITAQVIAVRRLPDREYTIFRDVCSAAGTFFAAALIWRVVPRDFLGLGWLALGIVCFETGLAAGVRWFRTQGDIAAGLGLVTLAGINVLGIGGVPAHTAAPLAAAAVLSYLVAARLFRLAGAEHSQRRDITLSAGTVFLAALCWYTLPNPAIAVSWGVLALLLLEIGIALPFPAARSNGHVMVACGIARLFAANFTITGHSLGISHRLLTVLPFAVLCYYLYELTRRAGDSFSRLYLYAGSILAVFLLRFELGRSMTVVGWSLFVLALLYFGLRLDKPDLRWQSYALALWTFVRSWTTNFYIPESLLGVRASVLTGAIVIASFYAAELLSPRSGETFSLGSVRLRPRVMFSLLATGLLTVLLCYEVSGSLLTVALGVQGIALLAAGFPMRERSLRLAGLALFLFCVLKLFVYDLRELETLYRILSFLVLGLLLLGASWVYTRFREQLRQYL